MKYLACLLLLLACSGANQKEVVPLIGHLSIMQHATQPNLVYISYLRDGEEVVIADGQIINLQIWEKAKVQWRSLNGDKSKTLLQSNKLEDQAKFTVSNLYKGQYWLDGRKEKGAYLLEAEVFFETVPAVADENKPLENAALLETEQETKGEQEEDDETEHNEDESNDTVSTTVQKIIDKPIAQRFVFWDHKEAYTRISRVSGTLENVKGQEILVVFVDGYTGEFYFSWSNRDTQMYLLEIPQYRDYLVYLFGDKLFLDAGQLRSTEKKIERNYSLEAFEQHSDFGFVLGIGEFSQPHPLTKKNIEIKINLVHYSPSKSIAWLVFHRQENSLYFKIINTSVEANTLEFSLPEDNVLINSIISIDNHETIRPLKQLITVSDYRHSLQKLQNTISAKISLDIDNDGLADSCGDLDKDNDGIIDSEEEEISRS